MGNCISGGGAAGAAKGPKKADKYALHRSSRSRAAEGIPSAADFGLPPDQFEVVRLLGHGGEATTYLAKDRSKYYAKGLLSLDGSLSHEASTLSAHAPTATRSGDSLTGGAPAPTPGHSGRGLGLYKAAFANSQKELPYELVALKILPRGETLDEKFVFREIVIQSTLAHIHIVKLKEVLLTHSHLILKLEYAAGGELYQYIKKQKPSGPDQLLTEEHGRYFFHQFVDTVHYLHSHRVAHRDLKLANTLIDGSDPPRLKLCDFGLSRMWERNEQINATTTVGTPMYIAPEIMTAHKAREKKLNEERRQQRAQQLLPDVVEGQQAAPAAPPDSGPDALGATPGFFVANGGPRTARVSESTTYDPLSADLWSVGVLLFVLLLGRFPFKASTVSHGFDTVLKEIRMAHAVDPDHLWGVWGSSNLTPEAKDLLDRIFVMDHTKRITIDEIRAHPWYTKPFSAGYEKVLRACREAQERAQKEGSALLEIPKGSEMEVALRHMVHEAAVVQRGPEHEVQRWAPPMQGRIRTVMSQRNLQQMAGPGQEGADREAQVGKA